MRHVMGQEASSVHAVLGDEVPKGDSKACVGVHSSSLGTVLSQQALSTTLPARHLPVRPLLCPHRVAAPPDLPAAPAAPLLHRPAAQRLRCCLRQRL